MAHPTLPPYLGTWDELVQALLNNPFLGSGGGPHPHLLQSLSERMRPRPEPSSPACALFVLAAALKDVASRLPEGQQGPLGSAIAQATDDWDEWYCGNGPRPNPHVVETVGELLGFAGALEPGSLRAGIAAEAGALLQKSFGAAGIGGATVTSIAS